MRRARDPAPPPLRAQDAHKASVGRVLVVGGSRGMAGAPFLAGYGALRAGAGLVRLAVPASLQDVVAGFAPEVLTADLAESRSGALAAHALTRACDLARACDAVVLGPGAGRERGTQTLLRQLTQRLSGAVVVDADALFAWSRTPRALAACSATLVLTPHEGEAARLLGRTAAQVHRGREEAACALQALTGALVVLKGPGTWVVDGTQRWRCERGGPVLASGGTGDVLAGVLAALLAGAAGGPFEAACRAVAWHARAGDQAARGVSDRGLLARDLADALPTSLGAWRRARTPRR